MQHSVDLSPAQTSPSARAIGLGGNRQERTLRWRPRGIYDVYRRKSQIVMRFLRHPPQNGDRNNNRRFPDLSSCCRIAESVSNC